jgi:hypothetical protein
LGSAKCRGGLVLLSIMAALHIAAPSCCAPPPALVVGA